MSCRSGSASLGGLDSFTDVGLLSRESEMELGRIVQSGMAAELPSKTGKAAEQELSDDEQAACLGLPVETMKVGAYPLVICH